MNPATDMFDFSKNLETFAKFYPDFANSTQFRAATDMAAKVRNATIEAMHRNVELTAAWMKDAAKDAETLMTVETQPNAYVKKAGEVATAAMQDLPSRLFAYAEVAKKAQTEIMDTVIAVTPKVMEEAVERTKSATPKANGRKAA